MQQQQQQQLLLRRADVFSFQEIISICYRERAQPMKPHSLCIASTQVSLFLVLSVYIKLGFSVLFPTDSDGSLRITEVTQQVLGLSHTFQGVTIEGGWPTLGWSLELSVYTSDQHANYSILYEGNHIFIMHLSDWWALLARPQILTLSRVCQWAQEYFKNQ